MNLNHIPFHERLLPAPVGGGFAMDGWWVWCGAAALTDDGRYHLLAARWPQHLKFLPAYQSYSEIVRAVSDTPEGPYEFVEVVLGDRGSAYWDGRMTHNPVLAKWGDRHMLFYIGTTFEGPKPTAEEIEAGPMMAPWYRQISIGVATADSPAGPWQRPDKPLFVARPGMWDEHVVTNPSPLVTSDGRLFVYYRSFIKDRGCRLGLVIYEELGSEPVWRSDEPLFDDDNTSFEDPFVWQAGDHFEMIAKDLTGNTTGELFAGTHLLSADGIHWEPAPEPKAYSRTVLFDDGSTRELRNLERPFLLIEEGEPTHFFAAMGEGGEAARGFLGIERSWNGVIPLRTDLG